MTVIDRPFFKSITPSSPPHWPRLTESNPWPAHRLTYSSQFEKARELYYDTWLGFPEVELAEMITSCGFREVETAVVDREEAPPHFRTLLASAAK